MEDYVRLSIETHLFFARIMKEHALFLEAGFPGKDKTWIEKSDHFRQQFENLLEEAVEISNGIPINSCISAREQKLQPGCKSLYPYIRMWLFGIGGFTIPIVLFYNRHQLSCRAYEKSCASYGTTIKNTEIISTVQEP